MATNILISILIIALVLGFALWKETVKKYDREIALWHTHANDYKVLSDLLAEELTNNKATNSLSLKPLGTFKTTYYSEEKYHNKTKSGKELVVGRTVAVDTNIIPLGTLLYIEDVGFRYADDTGSLIKGKIIDIAVKTQEEAEQLGVEHKKVYIVQDHNIW